MKRLLVLCMILVMAMPCIACSNKKAEARQQAAYEQGMAQAQKSIKKEVADNNDINGMTNEEHTALANSLKKEKKEAQEKTPAQASGVQQQYQGAEGPTYVIDTLNNRIHKHKSGCSLLGAESGRSTIEPWYGTVQEANNAGYTSCPECILKLGAGRS